MKQRGHCGPAREDRARKDAQVLLRAGRELAAGQDADGEPMRRYTYPVGPVGVRSGQEAGDPLQTRILVAAVNSLTSAVLASLCRTSGRE